MAVCEAAPASFTQLQYQCSTLARTWRGWTRFAAFLCWFGWCISPASHPCRGAWGRSAAFSQCNKGRVHLTWSFNETANTGSCPARASHHKALGSKPEAISAFLTSPRTLHHHHLHLQQQQLLGCKQVPVVTYSALIGSQRSIPAPAARPARDGFEQYDWAHPAPPHSSR